MNSPRIKTLKPRKGQNGICKLTGRPGKLVKSHLIPRALARRRANGEPFAELLPRARPKRRFDSWFDVSLVTQEGEDILTDYDTFAINELRRHKLVWRSWGPMASLCTSDWKPLPGTHTGLRSVTFKNAAKLRLFFLSLLWRSAATDRPEFAEVTLKASDMRRLKRVIRDGDVNDADTFFPVTLTQISTRGMSHNQAPLFQIKQAVAVAGARSTTEPIFRYFLDGLVAHIHINRKRKSDGLSAMIVGSEPETLIPTVTWASSWQAMNLAYCIEDTEHLFPGAMVKAENREQGS